MDQRGKTEEALGCLLFAIAAVRLVAVGCGIWGFIKLLS